MTKDTISSDAVLPSASTAAQFFTPAQIAQKLGVAKSALYEWLARGDIAYHRFGRIIRISTADVEDYLSRTRSVSSSLYAGPSKS